MNNDLIKISWFGKHFGEEPPLVGSENQGAGTIFTSGCNLKCVFCQNYQISQGDCGRDYSIDEVAGIMLGLQEQGAVNIDLVTPTVWWRQLKAAIILARKRGLILPIAWNSNAYESVRMLRELEGLIDIYLPDFKYGENAAAVKYSQAPEYCAVAEKAIREMYRQVGLLKVSEGLAVKGLIIRHLIIPGNINNTLVALEKIAGINNHIHLSLMSQYYPAYRSTEFPELGRQVSAEEIALAEEKKEKLELDNGWVQEPGSGEVFLPDFNKENPF